MTITKIDFAEMLQSKLKQTSDIATIAKWAYNIYLANIQELEPGLKDVLLDLARMEDSTEFEYSGDELMKLAVSLGRS